MCSCEEEDIAGLVYGAGELYVETLRQGGGSRRVPLWAMGRMPGSRNMQHASCTRSRPEAPKGADTVLIITPYASEHQGVAARVPNPGRSRLPSTAPVAPRRCRYDKPSAAPVQVSVAVSMPSWRQASRAEQRRRSMRGGTG